MNEDQTSFVDAFCATHPLRWALFFDFDVRARDLCALAAVTRRSWNVSLSERQLKRCKLICDVPKFTLDELARAMVTSTTSDWQWWTIGVATHSTLTTSDDATTNPILFSIDMSDNDEGPLTLSVDSVDYGSPDDRSPLALQTFEDVDVHSLTANDANVVASVLRRSNARLKSLCGPNATIEWLPGVAMLARIILQRGCPCAKHAACYGERAARACDVYLDRLTAFFHTFHDAMDDGDRISILLREIQLFEYKVRNAVEDESAMQNETENDDDSDDAHIVKPLRCLVRRTFENSARTS